MADLRSGVPSPCNQICVLNGDKVCIGCGRSSEEIGSWSGASVEQQLEIIANASERLRRINAPTANKGLLE